jgi:hypothetical protein
VARALLAVVVFALVSGCKKRVEEKGASAKPGPASAVPVLQEVTVEIFPVPDAGGAIGGDHEAKFVEAADDGAWVTMCHGDRPRVVIEQGPGIAVDRILASGPKDLVVAMNGKLVHVDVEARNYRTLGDLGPAAIDGASRRIVFGKGDRVVIVDPATAPRELAAGRNVAAIALRGRRWAHVGLGDMLGAPGNVTCNQFAYPPEQYEQNTTIDLDPSGVEAADRIGPTLGITATGEVTLDGEVVIDADCAAYVVAALATPPRLIGLCRSRLDAIVAGPGLRRELPDFLENAGEGDAAISPYLRLGRRVVCFNLGCVDLATAAYYKVRDDLVLATDDVIVRKEATGLLIDHIPADPAAPPPPSARVPLPRVVQAVTVDTATGRRHTGAAPVAPRLVDRAGRWLLYGRHVIDLQTATLVTTLADDAVAIDHVGRVLVPTASELGPLRWKSR